MTAPQLVTLPLDAVRPYWRNPRNISPEAVDKVKDSIVRYGYQNPIIVDTEHVIVTGHTRYAALRALGWAEASVIVSDLPPAKAKEYRVIDNRTAELAAWDMEALVLELREWEADLASEFFPAIDLLPSVTDDRVATTADQVARAHDAVANIGGGPIPPSGRPTTKLWCPHCFAPFDIDERTLAQYMQAPA
jgi:ParB-like nuclease domain